MDLEVSLECNMGRTAEGAAHAAHVTGCFDDGTVAGYELGEGQEAEGNGGSGELHVDWRVSLVESEGLSE